MVGEFHQLLGSAFAPVVVFSLAAAALLAWMLAARLSRRRRDKRAGRVRA